ncbi:hypothetical protein [Ferruginibacter sp.]
MEVLTIEELKETISVFSSTQCDFLSENCIVALEKNNHISGCKLNVTGDNVRSFNLNWSNKINTAGYRESKKIIEHAAETISFFLCTKFTNYTVIEEAVIGTGIDYWLGYNELHQLYNPKNFLQARLEISGIEKETPTNSLEKRVKGKKQQSKASDYSKLPAYISVVEFSTPKAFFGKR